MAERSTSAGHVLADRVLVRDTVDVIESQLRRWIAEPNVDVVLSTGGTGITGRDVTPEAFRRVMEKELPGFGELFRSPGPWLAWPMVPICSRFRDRPAPSQTRGTASCGGSSTGAPCHAPSSISCPACRSGNSERVSSNAQTRNRASRMHRYLNVAFATFGFPQDGVISVSASSVRTTQIPAPKSRIARSPCSRSIHLVQSGGAAEPS